MKDDKTTGNFKAEKWGNQLVRWVSSSKVKFDEAKPLFFYTPTNYRTFIYSAHMTVLKK